MTQALSDGVNEAISNLARSGMAGTEIHRRLLNGEAGVGEKPIQISLRRVQQIAQQAKQQGDPDDPLISDDQVDELTKVHLKHALNDAFRSIKRITGKQRKTARDYAELAAATKAAASIRRDLGQMAARSKHPQQSQAGASSKKDESTLERLARMAREAEQKQERPASSVSAPNGTAGNSSNADSSTPPVAVTNAADTANEDSAN